MCTKDCLLATGLSTEINDYEGVSVSFTFTGSVAMEQLCQNVAIIDDVTVENTESFTLSLMSPESQILIPIDSVQVLIEDNDGKLGKYR